MSGPKKTIFTGDPNRAARFTGRANGGGRTPPGGNDDGGCWPALLLIFAVLVGAAIALTQIGD